MTFIAKGKTLKEFAAHLAAGGDIEPIVVELELRSSNEDKGIGYRERNAKALAQVVDTGQLADLKAVWAKPGAAEREDIQAVTVTAKEAIKAAKVLERVSNDPAPAKPSAIEAAALAVAADPSPVMIAAFLSLVAKAVK